MQSLGLLARSSTLNLPALGNKRREEAHAAQGHAVGCNTTRPHIHTQHLGGTCEAVAGGGKEGSVCGAG
jgi:hypothetical protein